jgi:DNA repair protein RadD
LTTGVDWKVNCLILARPTRSEMLYVQIIGRALRIAEGKADALILDHSDTTQRLGFVTDIHHDKLDDGKPKKAAEKKPPPLPKECESCGFLKPPRVATCPNCGHKRKVSSDLMEQDGELVEVTGAHGQKKGVKRVWTMEEKAQFLAELKTYGLEHGYKPGWASRKYKDRFDVWPDWSIKDIAPAAAISTATSMWIRSQQIAWAKSKNNPANHRHDNHAPPQDDLFAPLELE